jgi:HK97 family phage portal protein
MSILNRLTQRAITPQQAWGADIEWDAPNSAAGIHVDGDTARKLVVVWACQRLLTNSISTMPVKVFRKVGDKRAVVEDPSWLKEPTTNKNDTSVDHFADVAMSLLGDGNSFTRCLPFVALADYVYVADSTRVTIDNKDSTVYRISGVGDLRDTDILHISLLRKPGKTRGMSPIDNALDSIGIGLAAQEFGSRFFSNGTTLSGVIQMPVGAQMTPEAIKNLGDSFKIKHQGIRKSHAVGVLTNGGTFNKMTSTPQESQLLELRKFQVEDIARLYGVPPHMVGSQEPGAVAYASVEQRAIDYVQYGVQPLVVKIERAYQRLLPPDHYLKFNLAALLRGDTKSRFEAYRTALQNKFMTVNEVRAFEDFEPFAGEEGGLLQTPNNNAPDKQPDGSPDE